MSEYNQEIIIKDILKIVEETKQFTSKNKANILVSRLYNITKKIIDKAKVKVDKTMLEEYLENTLSECKIDEYKKEQIKKKANYFIYFLNINPQDEISKGGDGTEDEDCSICLNTIENDDSSLTCPYKESHKFHQQCILEWLKINKTCPLCRGKVEISSDNQTLLKPSDSHFRRLLPYVYRQVSENFEESTFIVTTLLLILNLYIQQLPLETSFTFGVSLTLYNVVILCHFHQFQGDGNNNRNPAVYFYIFQSVIFSICIIDLIIVGYTDTDGLIDNIINYLAPIDLNDHPLIMDEFNNENTQIDIQDFERQIMNDPEPIREIRIHFRRILNEMRNQRINEMRNQHGSGKRTKRKVKSKKHRKKKSKKSKRKTHRKSTLYSSL